MFRILAGLGRMALDFLQYVGGVFVLLGRLIRVSPQIVRSLRLMTIQMLQMGVNSLPLVVLVSVFTGSVAAWQAAYQFESFVPMRYLGTAVGKAITIELAPVLTALVMAGRVGASIAAELGTMRVTEQIDALEVMAIDPVRYLVLPRVASGIIMMPILVIFANVVAIAGALVVAVLMVHISSETFMNGVKRYFYVSDFMAGLTKAAIFGLIISFIGCYQGFVTTGGAEGVGKSTTRAVVVSAVLILIADFIVATVLFQL
jgi:phospholipid/cholesterol/gamma-HCH transport system permease protein